MGSLLRLTQFLCFLFFHFHLQASFYCSLPLSSNFSSSKHWCPTDQSLALLQFKKSFSINSIASDSPDSYPKTESWKEGTDCCSWNGITCDVKTGHVIGLDLAYSMLYGTLHPNSTLFSLLQLRKLDLSDNDFNSSPISSQFGQFFNLMHLNLSLSLFSGQVPPEISLLSRLVSLNLSRNYLTGQVPPEISLLSRLVSLDLSRNDLKGQVPPEISLLSRLVSLNLSENDLTGQVPPEISLLSRLVSLNLSNNHDLTLEPISFNKLAQNLTQLRELNLDGVNMSLVVPDSLMNLSSSLSSLHLRDCGLLGKFPDNLFRSSNLQFMALGFNEGLNVSFPPFNVSSVLSFLDMSYTRGLKNLDLLGTIKSLKTLYISECNFVGSSLAVLDDLTQLTELDISNNHLGGHIPFSLRKLERLNYLNLRSNNFTGPIPDDFVNLTQLTELDLSYNGFEGHLPSSLANLKQLSYLFLSANNFNGQILNEFANLTHLTVLDLSNNNFSDHTPSPLGSLTQLTGLSLSSSTFSCQLSNEFANLTKLTYLDLSNNKFCGRILSLLGNLTELIWLDLPNNRFVGQIPSSLGNLQKLSYLNLSSNNFTGEIPNGWGNLTQLRYLDLSNNRLIGQIPSSLFALPFLRNTSFFKGLMHINLSHNKLHGQIPPSVFKLQYLRALILSSNHKLTGEISSVICKLKFLQILDLSHNEFRGFIPQCLGNFSDQLSVLHLGANNLHGTIPSTFSKGCYLRYLNLNGNQLKGAIPPSVINCTSLEFLDLGNNMIDDTFPSFLEVLSELEILVLRSNKLHGSLNGPTANDSFSRLRIFDLSNNILSGPLPTEYFNNFKAMVTVDQNIQYMKAKNVNHYSSNYDYSVTLTWKGLKIEFAKIQTALTTIDLSGNTFGGKIPESLGKLESLKELNLSHNRLAGYIQPSLANLTNLESLDLSSNLLTGRIPQQLADITSLGVLNLSCNQLEGPIPVGKQFNTFERASYEGNSGLYGFPLPEKCNSDEGQQVLPPSNFQEEEDDSMFGEGFGWKAVAMGYGCGFVFGASIGYIVFRTRKPAWSVRMVEGGRRQNAKGHRRRNAPRNGERRN